MVRSPTFPVIVPAGGRLKMPDACTNLPHGTDARLGDGGI